MRHSALLLGLLVAGSACNKDDEIVYEQFNSEDDTIQVEVGVDEVKALIEEEFGDGIMSAIDFEMDIDRKADPKGDRVVITLNGKFLPYKTY